MRNLYYIAISIILFASCSSPIKEKLNIETLPEVVDIINSTDSLEELEKKYIVDNLNSDLKILSLMATNENFEKFATIPTFESEINESITKYDSIKDEYLTRRDNNKKLQEIFVFKSAVGFTSIVRNMFSLSGEYNNPFDKRVSSIAIEYFYKDENGTAKFKGYHKLIVEEDKPMKDFGFMTENIGIDIKRFLDENVDFMNTPIEEITQFISKGITCKVLCVELEDESMICEEDTEWEYLD